MTLASIGSVDFCLSFLLFSGFFIPDSCRPLIPLLWQAVSRSSGFWLLLLFCPFRDFSFDISLLLEYTPASDELTAQPFPIFSNFASTPTSRIRVTVYSVHRPLLFLPFSSRHSFSTSGRLAENPDPPTFDPASYENQCPAGSGC